jgi:hypothetical protein
MPAKQTVPITKSSDASVDMLTVDVEGDLRPWQSVYFTDQNPEFKVRVTNISDEVIKGPVRARVQFDESNREYESPVETINCELDPGESEIGVLEPDIMSYQGHGAVRIDRARVSSSRDESHHEITSRSGSGARAYTFMVYDRDYYRLNYLWPRRAQYAAAVLSVLIVAVGILQLLIG